MKTNVKPSEYSKTYATYAGAEKAAEKILADFREHLDEMGLHPRYIVAATENGRFSPVFINTQAASIWFVQKCFQVAG